MLEGILPDTSQLRSASAHAFSQLGIAVHPCHKITDILDQHICQLYVPRTKVQDVENSSGFSSESSRQSGKFPPIKATLLQHVERSNY